MERKISFVLKEWKKSETRKPLILTGCRQIGKTYSMMEFAKENYSDFVYVNLEEDPDSRIIFEGNLSAETIISNLSLYYRRELLDHETLIIFDEIQLSSGAISCLKSLSISGRFDVIASGSLLGLSLNTESRLSPMGYVDEIEMHPMDFEEFLWALGVPKNIVDDVKEKISEFETIDDYTLRTFSNIYRMFLVVGGMPAAVKAYVETKDYGMVRKQLKSILSYLESDAERYSGNVGKLRIMETYRSIPSQISRNTGRFQYSDISKTIGKGKREYGSALLWLQKAGLIRYSYNVEEPVAPLYVRERQNSFKVFLNDTGLLLEMMSAADAFALVNSDPFANNGAIMENAVACDLCKNGFQLHFYEKRDSTLEVDFLINEGQCITAIEVKSGLNKRSKSLKSLKESRKDVKAIKIMDGNILCDENGIMHYPLFAAAFMMPVEIKLSPVDIDELIRHYDDKTRIE